MNIPHSFEIDFPKALSTNTLAFFCGVCHSIDEGQLRYEKVGRGKEQAREETVGKDQISTYVHFGLGLDSTRHAKITEVDRRRVEAKT